AGDPSGPYMGRSPRAPTGARLAAPALTACEMPAGIAQCAIPHAVGATRRRCSTVEAGSTRLLSSPRLTTAHTFDPRQTTYVRFRARRTIRRVGTTLLDVS